MDAFGFVKVMENKSYSLLKWLKLTSKIIVVIRFSFAAILMYFFYRICYEIKKIK